MTIRNFAYGGTVNEGLKFAMSPARLSPYLIEVEHDLQAALDLYVWNVGAASALYGPLQMLEVTFRNAMDREMRALFGTDWPVDAAFVALAKSIGSRPPRKDGYKAPDLRKGLNQARSTIVRSFRETRPPGTIMPTLSTDDLVAATTFGYWTTMLDPAFEPDLWARGLKNAFPNYSTISGGKFSRAPISERFNILRKLRNRVMHHEPLFKRASLVADYDRIVEATAWINVDVSGWIEHHARFKAVLDLRDRPRHTF